jgi:flavodoxin
MKSIVLYDSLYGNTAKIAETIAGVVAERGEVATLKVGELQIGQLTGVNIFIVGSPTQQFRPTNEIKTFLTSIPKNGLKGVRVAAFDTRLTDAEINKPQPFLFIMASLPCVF